MSNIEDLINGIRLPELSDIDAHIICRECMAEVKADHPDIMPEEYGHLAVGFGGKGLVVYCLRHQRKVEEFELKNDHEGRLPY